MPPRKWFLDYIGEGFLKTVLETHLCDANWSPAWTSDAQTHPLLVFCSATWKSNSSPTRVQFFGLLSGCYEPTHRVHDNTHGVHMIRESSTTRKRWNQAAPPNSLISQCICGRTQSATSSTSSTFCSRSLAGNAVLHTSYCPPVRAISCFFDCSCFNNGASNGEWLLRCGPRPRWFSRWECAIACGCTLHVTTQGALRWTRHRVMYGMIETFRAGKLKNGKESVE